VSRTGQSRLSQAELEERLRHVRMVAMDCDGVLTDGGMYYAESGDEWKKFNTRDGKGVELLHRAGYLTAIITGEDTAIVERRAAKMGVDVLVQGAQDKLSALDTLLASHGLAYEQVVYVGDDLNDLPVMQVVGLACAVADATPLVRQVAHYVCERKGGEGAVREVAELILGALARADGKSS